MDWDIVRNVFWVISNSFNIGLNQGHLKVKVA